MASDTVAGVMEQFRSNPTTLSATIFNIYPSAVILCRRGATNAVPRFILVTASNTIPACAEKLDQTIVLRTTNVRLTSRHNVGAEDLGRAALITAAILADKLQVAEFVKTMRAWETLFPRFSSTIGFSVAAGRSSDPASVQAFVLATSLSSHAAHQAIYSKCANDAICRNFGLLPSTRTGSSTVLAQSALFAFDGALAYAQGCGISCLIGTNIKTVDVNGEKTVVLKRISNNVLQRYFALRSTAGSFMVPFDRHYTSQQCALELRRVYRYVISTNMLEGMVNKKSAAILAQSFPIIDNLFLQNQVDYITYLGTSPIRFPFGGAAGQAARVAEELRKCFLDTMTANLQCLIVEFVVDSFKTDQANIEHAARARMCESIGNIDGGGQDVVVLTVGKDHTTFFHTFQKLSPVSHYNVLYHDNTTIKGTHEPVAHFGLEKNFVFPTQQCAASPPLTNTMRLQGLSGHVGATLHIGQQEFSVGDAIPAYKIVNADLTCADALCNALLWLANTIVPEGTTVMNAATFQTTMNNHNGALEHASVLCPPAGRRDLLTCIPPHMLNTARLVTRNFTTTFSFFPRLMSTIGGEARAHLAQERLYRIIAKSIRSDVDVIDDTLVLAWGTDNFYTRLVLDDSNEARKLCEVVEAQATRALADKRASRRAWLRLPLDVYPLASISEDSVLCVLFSACSSTMHRLSVEFRMIHRRMVSKHDKYGLVIDSMNGHHRLPCDVAETLTRIPVWPKYHAHDPLGIARHFSTLTGLPLLFVVPFGANSRFVCGTARFPPDNAESRLVIPVTADVSTSMEEIFATDFNNHACKAVASWLMQRSVNAPGPLFHIPIFRHFLNRVRALPHIAILTTPADQLQTLCTDANITPAGKTIPQVWAEIGGASVVLNSPFRDLVSALPACIGSLSITDNCVVSAFFSGNPSILAAAAAVDLVLNICGCEACKLLRWSCCVTGLAIHDITNEDCARIMRTQRHMLGSNRTVVCDNAELLPDTLQQHWQDYQRALGDLAGPLGQRFDPFCGMLLPISARLLQKVRFTTEDAAKNDHAMWLKNSLSHGRAPPSWKSVPHVGMVFAHTVTIKFETERRESPLSQQGKKRKASSKKTEKQEQKQEKEEDKEKGGEEGK